MIVRSEISPIPAPHFAAARRAMQSLTSEGNILDALEALHETLGDVFALPLPGFRSIMLVGPEANRLLLNEERERFLWRSEGDPVTRLLRRGLLVIDGAFHDEMRQMMTPALHRTLFGGFIETMWQSTDRITDQWHEGARVDMFAEARRIALLIVTEVFFGVDIRPDLNILWHDILRTIHYISPGPWLLWPGMPRPGYRRAVRHLDAYVSQIIARRRAQGCAQGCATTDLLSRLIASGMRDELIRDQLLTIFIAGHDTSTALLAWTLYLLATHPDTLAHTQAEVDLVVGAEPPTEAHLRRLPYLERVIKESLRLYPPIHLGSRIAAADVAFRDYLIPAGTRVLYSIYLTHRDEKYWPAPTIFDPDRFAPAKADHRPAYTFLPFGAGPRNCLGAAFAQVEAKIVLVRLLQRFAFRYIGGDVRPRMRATLEPNPGVLVEAHHRHAELG